MKRCSVGLARSDWLDSVAHPRSIVNPDAYHKMVRREKTSQDAPSSKNPPISIHIISSLFVFVDETPVVTNRLAVASKSPRSFEYFQPVTGEVRRRFQRGVKSLSLKFLLRDAVNIVPSFHKTIGAEHRDESNEYHVLHHHLHKFPVTKNHVYDSFLGYVRSQSCGNDDGDPRRAKLV